MIVIYPSDDRGTAETTWEVWEGSTRLEYGLSPTQAGEAARQLTIKRAFEAMQRSKGAPAEEQRPARRGIYLSKEHRGRWEIWEDGICVESYESVEAAAEDSVQNGLRLRR